MHRIALDDQDEAVKRFVLSLALDSQGTLLELDGKPVVWVVSAVDVRRQGDGEEPWTKEKNERRCAGGLTPAEALELAQLQAQMLRWRQRVAPLPLEDARRLHQELLEKAARSPTAT